MKFFPHHINYDHLYNKDGSFGDEFYVNLVKTINWTEKITENIKDTSTIDYGRILRSTNPEYNGKPFYKFEDTTVGFAATPAISFNYSFVLQVALNERTNSSMPYKNITELGKILAFDIDITTHDGAPCAVSDGFVDESDIPPMDTWFYITTKHLYCWIPALFVDTMQAAINVEILDSYHWLEDLNPGLHLSVVERFKFSD